MPRTEARHSLQRWRDVKPSVLTYVGSNPTPATEKPQVRHLRALTGSAKRERLTIPSAVPVGQINAGQVPGNAFGAVQRSPV